MTRIRLFSVGLLVVLCSLVADVPVLEATTAAAVTAAAVPTNRQGAAVWRMPPPFVNKSRILQCRGGSSEEESSDAESDSGESADDSVSDDDDDGGTGLLAEIGLGRDGLLLKVGRSTLQLVGRIALTSIKATSRAVMAAFRCDEDSEDDVGDTSLVIRVTRVLKRMIKAAFSPGSESEDSEASSSDSIRDWESGSISKKTIKPGSKATETAGSSPAGKDFGNYLSQAYGIEASRDDLDPSDRGMPILGGPISDALRSARAKARLLVVLVPSSKPGKMQQHDADAIRGLLSAEVATVAERKARKLGDTGSYIIWGAKAGSAEAMTALKRTKATQTNSKGQKRPILLVVYPAQIVGSDGTPKIVPRLLAQHHCSPPPSSEMMAAWLNALRKRHAKQYATMQLEVKEEVLYKERQAGYKDSVQSDRERRKREAEEAEERRRKEEAEMERRETVKQRRIELKQSMPEEPPKDDTTAKTVALRFADGRSSQRRFVPDTKLATLFNWVDASFDLERELIVLTTLNGQKSFEWDASDLTLDEAGLGRMAGFRVSEKKKPIADA